MRQPAATDARAGAAGAGAAIRRPARLDVDAEERLGARETDEQPRAVVAVELESIVRVEGLALHDGPASESLGCLLAQAGERIGLDAVVSLASEADINAVVVRGAGQGLELGEHVGGLLALGQPEVEQEEP